MLTLFRRIRKSLLATGAARKYILYAIGEIALVVIGILLALQINNWNERRKAQIQADKFRRSLIAELENDLAELDEIELEMTAYEKQISNYVEYYDTPDPDMQILHQKMDSLELLTPNFHSSAYTIEEMISTGSLSLFTAEEKSAMLKLRNSHLIVHNFFNQNLNGLSKRWDATIDKMDMLFFNKYSQKEHVTVAGWQFNLDSEQFRLLNNEFAAALDFYSWTKENNQGVRKDTEALIKVLKRTLE